MALAHINRSPSYLTQTPYSYCFRIRIPIDLQDQFGKKELRYSLKTGYLSEAKSKARLMAGQVQRLFRYMRRGTHIMTELTTEELDEIIKEYVSTALDVEKQVTMNWDHGPLSPEEHQNMQRGYEIALEAVKDELARNDLSVGFDHAEHWLKERGIQFDRNLESHKRLALELMIKYVKLLEIDIERHKGDYSSKVEKELLEEINGNTPQVQWIQPPPPAKPVQTSDTFKEAADDYWEEYSDNLKPRSQLDYKGYLDHIVLHFGKHTQLHTVEYMDVKKFREGLKTGEYSLRGQPLSVSRINNYLGILKKMYDLAMKKDKNLDRINPAADLRLRDKVRPDEKRDIFTTEDLKKMFIESGEYGQDQHTNAHSFWIPLIGLYTGARLEEICQLFVTDVIKKDSIWCLDIKESDAPDMKSVKTSDQRIIPLHPFLVDDLNFIGYVEVIKEQGHRRVFSKLTKVRNRWGHYAGKRFTEFRKNCGIEAAPRKKVFHSFRHTLIDYLKQSGAKEKHVKEFVGHKGRGDITWDLYGKQFKPQVLMDEVVLKLNYGLDLNHLKTSKWVTDHSTV